MDSSRKNLTELLNYRTSLYHRLGLMLSLALLWFSGLAWLIVEIFELEEYSFLRSLMMKIHGAAAILFLIVFGALWLHMLVGLVTKLRKKTGLTLVFLSLFLIISGWVLYYLSNEALRLAASWSHSIVGLLFPLILLLHAGNKIREIFKKEI